jgi:feruloyl esterase
VDESFRLFMVPGMNHCQGGEGTDTINMQAAIEPWVEHGRAPSMLIGPKVVNGEVVRTHPLCPYPQEAVYNGSGSATDAMSFICKVR